MYGPNKGFSEMRVPFYFFYFFYFVGVEMRNSNGSYPVPYIGLKHIPVCLGLGTLFHILNSRYYEYTKNYSQIGGEIRQLGK